MFHGVWVTSQLDGQETPLGEILGLQSRPSAVPPDQARKLARFAPRISGSDRSIKFSPLSTPFSLCKPAEIVPILSKDVRLLSHTEAGFFRSFSRPSFRVPLSISSWLVIKVKTSSRKPIRIKRPSRLHALTEIRVVCPQALSRPCLASQRRNLQEAAALLAKTESLAFYENNADYCVQEREAKGPLRGHLHTRWIIDSRAGPTPIHSILTPRNCSMNST